MSARDAILGRVRKSLGVAGPDNDRAAAVSARLAKAPAGLIPERGKLDKPGQASLFCQQAEQVHATVARVKDMASVPKAVADYLRSKNLPASIRIGADTRLKRLPWKTLKALEVKTGASDGDDMAGVSFAFAGIAETGTLVMPSGPDNPTTINFLPEHHIVVIKQSDIKGDMESAFAAIRKAYGKGEMPRALNLITGPSRSGDVEQKLVLGAHGPRSLHIVMVGEEKKKPGRTQ